MAGTRTLSPKKKKKRGRVVLRSDSRKRGERKSRNSSYWGRDHTDLLLRGKGPETVSQDRQGLEKEKTEISQHQNPSCGRGGVIIRLGDGTLTHQKNKKKKDHTAANQTRQRKSPCFWKGREKIVFSVSYSLCRSTGGPVTVVVSEGKKGYAPRFVNLCKRKKEVSLRIVANRK